MLIVRKRDIKNMFRKNDDFENKIDLEKSALRYEVSIKKKKLTEEYKNSQAKIIFDKIEKHPKFIKAKSVLMYWSLPDEVPTHDFIKKWSNSKTILLPVVKKGQMTIRPFVSEDSLSEGYFNVMEPKSGKEYLKSVELAIIPGVAFDRKKRRLGRGKGYYDKYLKKRSIKKWGLCFDFQLFDKVPTTRSDIKMDMVFTSHETVS